MKTLILVAVCLAVLCVGCSKPVDRSTPEAFSKALIAALNSGSLSDVKRVLGDDFLSRAREECEAFKATAPIKRDGPGDPFANVDDLKRKAKCDEFESQFKDFLGRLKKSNGLKLKQVKKQWRDPSDTEMLAATADVIPPDGSRADWWALSLIDGQWTLEKSDFGWLFLSRNLAQAATWNAGEVLGEALKQ